MKKVTFEYGCRALGYTDGDFFVDDDMSYNEIQKKVDAIAEFSIDFSVKDGYREWQPVKGQNNAVACPHCGRKFFADKKMLYWSECPFCDREVAPRFPKGVKY